MGLLSKDLHAVIYNSVIFLCLQSLRVRQGYTLWFWPRPYVCLSRRYRIFLTDQPTGKLHKKGNKVIYISMLVLLWISVIASFAGDWNRTRAAFVLDDSSPSGILAELNAPLSIPWRITGLIAIFTSDAILVRSTIYARESSLQICRYGAVMYCGITDMSWFTLLCCLLQPQVWTSYCIKIPRALDD